MRGEFIESKKLVKGLTFEEFEKLISVIPPKDKLSKTSFLLGYGSGLRISEVVKLKSENIKENRIEIWDSKGGKDRIVPKPKGWREYMDKEIPIKKSIRTLERNFKKYAKKAKLPENYVFHSLRHGFALLALERGIPVNDLQLFMGHSSLSVTNVYTKSRPTGALERWKDLF